MVFTDFHMFSVALGIQTAVYVLLPDPASIEERHNEPIPTLYLLHGLSDDHTMWMRNTRIEQYARKHYLAVVMPAANRSFYMDMAYGARYWTFVSEELPRAMETYFPLCRTREGRFAAGLSMGGYGAMRLGLLCPDRYSYIASLSAPIMMQEAFVELDHTDAFKHELTAVYGSEEALRAGTGNLCNAADKLLTAPEKAPKMYVACGTEDDLFAPNEAFIAKYGEALHIDYHTEHGVHNWDFWDRQIQHVIDWLPLEKLEHVW